MGEIVLVTGGGRSGKSSYALDLASSYEGKKYFVATCPIIDGELEERVERHKRERDSTIWSTIEEQSKLSEIFYNGEKEGVYLVDCLTLWVNNLMYADENISEDQIIEKGENLVESLAAFEGNAVFITNEVGMGIIPGDSVSRRYRDYVGRINQIVAKYADKVVFMCSGIPMVIKDKKRVTL